MGKALEKTDSVTVEVVGDRNLSMDEISVDVREGSHEEVYVGFEDESWLKRFADEHLMPNLGLVLLSGAYLFNSIMVVSTKVMETDPDKLKEDRIKPLQILVVRMVITYIGTLIYMYWKRDVIEHVPFGPPELRKWLLLRGCVGFFGVFGMYFSLMYLTISDAVLITFLSPSLTIILAWLILREKITRFEVMGSIISLFGVVLIVRPCFLFGARVNLSQINDHVETSNPQERLVATLVALLGVIGASCVYIIIRFIGNRAHAIMSVSYFSLVTTVVSLVGILTIPSIRFQIPSSLKEWLLFGNLGICGFIFQLLLTMGIQRERAGRGSLMQYVQLIYAIFWDVSIWKRWPSFWSWCGMVLIVGSTIWVVNIKNSLAAQKDTLHMQDLENIASRGDSLELEDLSD
ncbi:hypothetical protein Kpol_2002p22 [Vanderwaltozyma polyspora DSM 70294]|uniref:EamA domain-containing protein n=1 Tax=Vanderwaltozyma polyspora (strain ATCC 22028 / DSM 70294 / BCRC 21397 / CBS 2163 / NBRC 10782 / NRRL Y-8283 / UCD 57-17) TaxID=436907 RepID=A7TFD8_VANPO|nr:uncharacterized protein Kpol_2002p22 [Vanderwaltozyma polyspora DSM 70294]EDO18952.1 hypothetical protein Kpol_2002p22 [Vanderwaltozyma polyspora DSM 70294]